MVHGCTAERQSLIRTLHIEFPFVATAQVAAATSPWPIASCKLHVARCSSITLLASLDFHRFSRHFDCFIVALSGWTERQTDRRRHCWTGLDTAASACCTLQATTKMQLTLWCEVLGQCSQPRRAARSLSCLECEASLLSLSRCSILACHHSDIYSLLATSSPSSSSTV